MQRKKAKRKKRQKIHQRKQILRRAMQMPFMWGTAMWPEGNEQKVGYEAEI